jgi:hypothetical protein
MFSYNCRKLGRSYALIVASRDLRDALRNLASKFRENATSICLDSEIDENSAFDLWFEGVAIAFEDFRDRLAEFRDYTVCCCIYACEVLLIDMAKGRE